MMRVLVTGHDGYIGAVLMPLFADAGHEVVGVDSSLFGDCAYGEGPKVFPSFQKDVRDLTVADLDGFDAVVHLAGISNDPLGDLNPNTTYEINHLGTVHVAKMAKAAGVKRFLFSSSCSTYGAAGDAPLDESADFNPVTPYGESKVLGERDVAPLASDDFTPVFLRNATAYGYSGRLRGDLVVNNLVGYALTTGEVRMKSDGTPWRPLVHILDISRAFLMLMEAPQEKVHLEAFNVGGTDENYRIREVAEIIEEVVPGAKIGFADSAGPDKRNYRVNCDKITDVIGFKPEWNVRSGAVELRDNYIKYSLTEEFLEGDTLQRIKTIRRKMDNGTLGSDLRWTGQEASKD
jgi:nucleoside-diphosphate-sugar epimerase